MEPRVRLVSIMTNNIEEMLTFYKEVLGFTSDDESGDYIEFKHEGVRIALCSRQSAYELTEHADYKIEPAGQSFELAFWVAEKSEVDATFTKLVRKGAVPIMEPKNMPWGQRTAVFADPDGNCHELYAD